MIILICGLPGTGKSFFADKLRQKIHSAYVNTDIIRSGINKKGQYDPETKQLVYNKLLEKLEGFVKTNRSVIVDGTFHKRDKRKQIKDKAKSLNQQLFIIEMRACDDTVKERVKHREGYSEADFKVYLQLKNTSEPINEPHLILWSDQLSVEEMLRKAFKYIQD